MRSVLLGSLRLYTRRYVAAMLAVMMAVGFVVVTNALGSASKNGLSAGVDAAYPGADLIIGDEFGMADEDVTTVLAQAERSGDRAAVVANTWTSVAASGTSFGDEVAVSTVADDSELRRQEILTGRAPREPDEALVKESRAASAGVQVGDELTLGTGANRQQVTVVGLTKGATYLDAAVHIPWETMTALDGLPDAVVYDVAGDGAIDDRAQELNEQVTSDVQSRNDYVDQRVTTVNQGVDVVSYLLLLFAAVAGFVAVLVIANTFTILFAQRSRDLALLRCVGATRRQLVRSVRTESLLLAIVAASIGIGGGAVAGYGLAAIARAFAPDRVGAVELSAAWLVPAFLGGVATTLLAAWWPTRSVARVSPLDALRPAGDGAASSRSGGLRLAFGLIVGVGGVGLLALAVAAESMPVLMAGGMTSFTGVLLLGPVLVPALLRLLGKVTGRAGPAARLASANAVRNPRRSAATTASLLVGATLTTAVLTGMSSARSAVDVGMDAEHPVDVTLTGSSVGDDLIDRIADVEGVDVAAGVPGTTGDVGPLKDVTLLGPDSAAREVSRDHSAVTPRDGEILVPAKMTFTTDDPLPAEVTVTAGGRSTTLRTRVVTVTWGEAAIVSPGTLETLSAAPGSRTPYGAIWLRADAAADPDTLGGDVGAAALGTNLETTNALQDRAWVDLQLDVLVWSVLALLGVGVAIALVGIANTVGLSVLERGREHALLRALGLRRRQLRRMLAAEGLLLALVAAVLGTALGVTYGWLGVATVVAPLVPAATLDVPWLQLGAVVLTAAAAGLAACVLPARRAATVMPAEGLTLD